MEISRCKALIECAEKGSISAAADALGYTPSAISQLITALEKELGLKLLNRSPKGVRLTAEGEEMLPALRSYLIREAEIYSLAEELKGVVAGKLTVAAYPSVAITWLPEIVKNFKANYPGIQIEIRESVRTNMFELLEQNKADMGIMAYSEPMPFEWIPLAEEEVIAVLPEDHPLVQNDCFPIEECEKDDFIMGSWGKEMEVIDILKKYGANPTIKYTTYDTPATIALVRMGLGISFVNSLSAQFWNEGIVKRSLDPPQFTTFGIAIPSKSNMTNASRKFLDYVLSYIRESNAEAEE